MYKNFWRNFLNASPMTFLHPTFLPPPYKLNIQFRWKKSYNPSKMDTYLNFNFLKNKIKKSKITKSYNFIFSSFFFQWIRGIFYEIWISGLVSDVSNAAIGTLPIGSLLSESSIFHDWTAWPRPLPQPSSFACRTSSCCCGGLK